MIDGYFRFIIESGESYIIITGYSKTQSINTSKQIGDKYTVKMVYES